MSGVYPYFKSCYTHEELVDHFLLTPADLQLALTCRGDANRLRYGAPAEGADLPRLRPGEAGSHARRGSLVHCPDNWVYFGTSATNIRGIAARGISIYS
jgi:hypothetical protein